VSGLVEIKRVNNDDQKKTVPDDLNDDKVYALHRYASGSANAAKHNQMDRATHKLRSALGMVELISSRGRCR
jgi:hypothetical protein